MEHTIIMTRGCRVCTLSGRQASGTNRSMNGRAEGIHSGIRSQMGLESFRIRKDSSYNSPGDGFSNCYAPFSKELPPARLPGLL